MSLTATGHRWLIRLIILIAIGAATWGAAMLAAGFIVSGQLESPANPLGRVVPYLAAAAMVSAAAVFFYILGHGPRPLPPRLTWGLGGIVAALIVFGAFTQAFMIVDGAMGTGFVKEAEARVAAAAQRAGQIDQAMTAVYARQVAHHETRMNEEAATGRGARYRQAQAEFNDVRAKFGSALAPLPPPALGGSPTADAMALLDQVPALRGKAGVVIQFAASTGVTAPNFTAEIAELENALRSIAGQGWIDRRALVSQQLQTKLGEMITSGGLTDIGFTLSFLLALVPDAIQVLCAGLLFLLGNRPKADEEDDLPGESGEDDWTPTAACPWSQGHCPAQKA